MTDDDLIVAGRLADLVGDAEGNAAERRAWLLAFQAARTVLQDRSRR